MTLILDKIAGLQNDKLSKTEFGRPSDKDREI